MSAFDDRMAALATRQINAKGSVVGYLAAALATAAYDAATLTVQAVLVAPRPLRAVVAPARASSRTGVQLGDVGFLVAGSDLPDPAPGDSVAHNGTTYRIVAIDTTWAGARAVTHLLTGRAA
jgi:hypothetical protein